MRKKDLLAALEPFGDDDHIMIGDEAQSFVPRITRVCGGQMHYMGYYCVRPPGHEGRCYCSCKHVDFDQEDMTKTPSLDDDENND